MPALHRFVCVRSFRYKTHFQLHRRSTGSRPSQRQLPARKREHERLIFSDLCNDCSSACGKFPGVLITICARSDIAARIRSSGSTIIPCRPVAGPQTSYTSMQSQPIEIAGPGGGSYQLGEPMLMFTGGVFLGRVDPVVLSKTGAEVHFGSFTATSLTHEEPRNVGALLFYEACAHLTRFHPQIQQIHFALSRPMPGLGDPATQASSRVAAVESIGAINIQLTPTRSGYTVVSGSWVHNERNLHLLHVALEVHRGMYAEQPLGVNNHLSYWLKRFGLALSRAVRRAKPKREPSSI